MKIGIVGATGLVGQRFLKLLSPFHRQIQEIRLFARSKKDCDFNNQKIETQILKEKCFEGLDVCFFSAGKEVSSQWGPQAEKEKVIVIDNSSAFRRDPDKLLIVPEVNGDLLNNHPQIISNPNCSTIQLVLALHPLQEKFGLEEVRVVSLQSISGAGSKALNTLKEGSLSILAAKTKYEEDKMETPFNCVPYIGSILENGFCEEEAKIIFESKKILRNPDLKISAFTVRVPTLNSHGEVLWFSLKKPPSSIKDIEEALSPYVKVHSFEDGQEPPHGRQASGKADVFVGRVHQDGISKKSWVLWLVADNLLKGASLNGFQIAQKIFKIEK
ncbi:MAG: aspartate-semialdehyde dehydrogenase [Bdellovibrionales bacterium]